MLHRDLREQNRRSWNAVVPAHNSHRGDQAAFFRHGGATLFPEELELLGDVAGCELAHLMCNAGQDTLSLARLGAVATGVDISDAAIAAAQELAAATGITAAFVRMDVYDWLAATATANRRFDVIYCGYGAICWLPDLAGWAAGVATALRPGGRFAVVDFHPVSNMFDKDWNLVQSYFAAGQVIASPGIADYVAESQGGLTPAGFVAGVTDFTNPEPCFLFQWGLGEVVSALAGAGLIITTLREYAYTNGERPFAAMRELPGRRMVPPERVPAIPLMYGIAARKP